VFLVVPLDFYRGVYFLVEDDYVASICNSYQLPLRRTLVRLVILFVNILCESKEHEYKQ